MEEKTTDLDKAQQIYTDAYNDKDLHDDLISNVSDEFGYHIQPDLTFTALIDKIDHGTFQLEDLSQSFRDIEQSSEFFSGLFEDVDLYSRKLGATPQKQNQVISDVMKQISTLDLVGQNTNDILGDAYEYLIGQFASDPAKMLVSFIRRSRCHVLLRKSRCTVRKMSVVVRFMIRQWDRDHCF